MTGAASGLAAVLLWGMAPVALKSLVGPLSGATVSTAIYALAAGLTLPWLLRAWRQGGVDALTWLRVIAIGVMLTSAFNLLVSLAATGVRGTTIGAVVALEPLMVALFAAALTRRWPARATVAALLLSLAGVWLLIAPAGAVGASGRDAPWAVALVVLGAALWSAAVVLASRLGTPWPPLQTSMVMICAGSLPFLLAAPWVLSGAHAAWSPGAIGGVLFMAVGVTVLANVLWLHALRAMGAVSTSLLINLVPLTTVSLSVIWLGEPWTTRQLAGTVLVLSALLLNPLLQALSRHRAKPLLP